MLLLLFRRYGIALFLIAYSSLAFGQAELVEFTFTDPPGWERYVTNQLSMLTHKIDPGVLLVWPNPGYTDLASVEQELSQPYREATTLLTPTVSLEKLGDYAYGSVVTGQLLDNPCAGYLIGFHLPGGSGGNILVAANPGALSAVRTRHLAIRILESVRAKRAASPVTATPESIGQNTLRGTGAAASLLAGYRLASISSGGGYDGGYRSREYLHFCPSGLIKVTSESSFYISGGYGSAAGEDSDTTFGYWKLEGQGNAYILTLQVNGKNTQERLGVIPYEGDEVRFKLKGQYYGYYGAADCN